MRKFLRLLHTNRYSIFKNTVIGITAITLFVASIVIDNNDSVPGRGFEAAKVTAIQIGSISIIFLALLFLILLTVKNIIRKEKSELLSDNKIDRSLIFILLLVLSIILSTLLSPYRDTALDGNVFRFQGLNTYLPIFLAAYIVYRCVDRKNIHLILLSIIFSGIANAVLGFSQFYTLAQTDIPKITDGLWVNGYYGQANFFSSHMIIAIILGAFYLSPTVFNKLKRFKYLTSIITAILITILAIALLFSFSEWGWVSLFVSVVFIIAYELLTEKKFFILITAGMILFVPVAGAVYFLYPRYELRFDIWMNIKNIMIYGITTDIQKLPNSLFGFGFDTLGRLFQDHGIIPQLLIDRGHNILFDILVQTGFFGLAFFFVILGRIFRFLKRIIEDRLLFFVSFSVLIWTFKSLVNEYSITNFFQWIILIAGCLALIEIHKKKTVEQ